MGSWKIFKKARAIGLTKAMGRVISRSPRPGMVAVAKWLTHRIVIPTYVGSIPISHPIRSSSIAFGCSSFFIHKKLKNSFLKSSEALKYFRAFEKTKRGLDPRFAVIGLTTVKEWCIAICVGTKTEIVSKWNFFATLPNNAEIACKTGQLIPWTVITSCTNEKCVAASAPGATFHSFQGRQPCHTFTADIRTGFTRT